MRNKHNLVVLLCGLFILLLHTGGIQSAAAQNNLPPLTLVGNAVLVENMLRLTADQKNQTGAAWLPAKQPVQGGFTATFDWQIFHVGAVGADGFAFVIQNASDAALGAGGGGIGYSGTANSIAVEFDTTQNPPEEFGGMRGDPNANHLSVQSRGTIPNSADPTYSLGTTTTIPVLSDGNVHRAKVTYVPGTLTIFLDDFTNPVLTVPVELATTLSLADGQAWVGFTAATGGRSQTHDISSFSFTGTAAKPTNFSAQMDGGQEVPPRTTATTGHAIFHLRDETHLDFTLNLLNVKNFVAAHIHCAPAGENGAVGATLFGPLPPGMGSVDIFTVQAAITAPDGENECGWADLAAVVAAMRSGNAYVNVHTDDGVDPADTGSGDFQSGELRGQIK
jgi:hypothetical protein